MSYKRITVEVLKDAGVDCTAELRKFKRLWPNGCTCTLANCRAYAKKGLGLAWVAGSLLGKHREFRAMTERAYWAWEPNQRKRGLRAALAEADARAFHKLAKGILR